MTMGEQERILEQLRQRIFNLNKSQFVLSHQINELKGEIRPRDDLLGDMKDRQNELSAKLEQSQGQWQGINEKT